MTDRGDRVLHSERLDLRPLDYAAATDLSTGGDGGYDWAPGGPYQGTRDAATMLANAVLRGQFDPAWGCYVMVRTGDGVAVGGIGFHGPASEGAAEIGYDVTASARGKGYAAEAVRAVSGYALRQPGVELVVAHTDPDNVASQAVVDRDGFVRDGEGEDGLFRFVLRQV
jgi:RimJ/RimL family protein N-acetyltransferase